MNDKLKQLSGDILKNMHIAKKKINLRDTINNRDIYILRNSRIMKETTFDKNFSKYLKYLKTSPEKDETLNIQFKQKDLKYLQLKNYIKNVLINMPPFLLEHTDNFELKLFEQNLLSKFNVSKLSSPSGNNTPHCKIRSGNYNKKMQTINVDLNKESKDNISYLSNNEDNANNNEDNTDIEGVDFKLISEINLEQKNIDNEIKKVLSKEISYAKKHKYERMNMDINDTFPPKIPLSYTDRRKLNKFSAKKSFSNDKFKISKRARSTKFKAGKNNYLYTDTGRFSKNRNKAKNHTIINYKYIPNSNKYKEITFHKNCIFNNEFYSVTIPNNMTRKSPNDQLTKSLKIRKKLLLINQKINENNEEIIRANTSRQIRQKGKNILKHLTEIKSVMKQDKKYTDNCIDSVIMSRKRKQNQEDQFMKKEILRNKYYEYFIKNEKQLKRKKNAFKLLKNTMVGFDRLTQTSEIKKNFNHTLEHFCKRERFDKFVTRQVYNNYYDLRYKKNKESQSVVKKRIGKIKTNQKMLFALHSQLIQDSNKYKSENVTKIKRNNEI